MRKDVLKPRLGVATLVLEAKGGLLRLLLTRTRCWRLLRDELLLRGRTLLLLLSMLWLLLLVLL
jgi:hypothetical protein